MEMNESVLFFNRDCRDCKYCTGTFLRLIGIELLSVQFKIGVSAVPLNAVWSGSV